MALVPTPCTSHQPLPSWLGIIDSHCSPGYTARNFHTFCPLHSLLPTLPPPGRLCKTDPLLWGWILQGGEVRPPLPDGRLGSARGSVQTRRPSAKNVAGKGRDNHGRTIDQTWNHLIVLLCFLNLKAFRLKTFFALTRGNTGQIIHRGVFPTFLIHEQQMRIMERDT